MRPGPPSAKLRVAGLLAALALVAALALAAPSLAAASAPASPSGAAQPDEVGRALAYWTPARMRAAEPLDGPTPIEDLASASFAPVAESNVPPFTVNGRLFVRQGNEQGFCSATAINSATRRLVLTAAHCLNTGPRGLRGRTTWSRTVVFVPAYTNGLAPFGAFVAHRNDVHVPKQWLKLGNPNFDIGAAEVQPNAEGVNVADAVGGGATIALDLSRKQQFQTFGYPGMVNRMQDCSSPYVGDDSTTYPIPGPPTIAIRCHWAPGASGGGWLIEEGRTIDGLTSYAKRRDLHHTFGPYFSKRNVGALVAGL
jgi:V8-like Glu-specific endopeptidase